MGVMKLAAVIGLFAGVAGAADFRAGVARLEITPKTSIWMSGYGDRKHPSDGVLHPLWAKALAIEDGKKNRVVMVTTDLIGLPRSISDVVAARILKQFGLDRSRLVLNSSHTHTGPYIGHTLPTLFDFGAEDQSKINAYAGELTENLVAVIGAAIGKLEPAQVSFGFGVAHFAINRREATPNGVKIGVNPQGPVDPDVPVIRVLGLDGSLKAVLFGYACHNTTLTGQFYQLSGDYAGFAQIELEKAHPGATAMFLMLCGGDQNPNPRSTLELARQHGKTLAGEVERMLSAGLTPLRPPIRAAFENIELDFALHTRETFEAELKDPNPSKVRRAKAMLLAYDERKPIRHTAYPIQAVRFGNGLTLLALGGEVVVDYALRAKREYPGSNLVVAGYSNDVMSYIPTKRVLQEGGYEPVDSMAYYGQPGPYADDVEERIFTGIRQVLKRVRVTPSRQTGSSR